MVGAQGTAGWRTSTAELVAALRRCGARVCLAEPTDAPDVRTMALTDLVQARAARRACAAALRREWPRGIVYCSVTAALLWPRPGAIWLDTLAAENRPGRHGFWQRPLERRRLAQAPLVMTMSERALDPMTGPRPPTVVLPVPVTPSAPDLPSWPARDVAVLTYGAHPEKKRLHLILAAWEQIRGEGETLVVAGLKAPSATPPGVRFTGLLAREEYRALLRRARVFVAAPRLEDHGIAQLEALADGCVLVSTPAAGPYPARDLARALDPRLVSEDLGAALRTALDDPLDGYAQRARNLLRPFSPSEIDQTLAQRVLPVLCG